MVKRSLALLIVAAPATALAQPAPARPTQGSHSGFTFETGVGIGVLNAEDGNESTTDVGVTLPSLSVGAWIGRNVVISGRAVITTSLNDRLSLRGYSSGLALSMFFGPTVQVWIGDRVWFGGGPGVTVLDVTEAVSNRWGLGFDARFGYELTSTSNSSYSVALELQQGRYDAILYDTGYHGILTSVAVVIGYQRL